MSHKKVYKSLNKSKTKLKNKEKAIKVLNKLGKIKLLSIIFNFLNKIEKKYFFSKNSSCIIINIQENSLNIENETGLHLRLNKLKKEHIIKILFRLKI
jgi:hypothetical protein